MTQITAALVKDLRAKSGAGMMDCKRALQENSGDMEAAVDWLRAKGLAKAAKKSGRVAAEGLVAAVSSGRAAAVVEVNAETDFVSRNPDFQSFVETVAQVALNASGDVDAERVLAAAWPDGGGAVADRLTANIATIGENMALRRCAALSVERGVVSTYVHAALKPGVGRIGVLVALESDGGAAALDALGRQIAMHVAAARPQFLNRDAVTPEALERERTVLAEQARESGKPEAIIDKMVDGRLRKYFEEVCLTEQPFVIDPDRTVSQAVADAAKDAGAPVRLAGFVRYELGEGIEREEQDFAAEVQAAAQG